MKNITLSENEINALYQLMDAGVRQLGLAAVDNAAFLKNKIESSPAPEEGPVQQRLEDGQDD